MSGFGSKRIDGVAGWVRVAWVMTALMAAGAVSACRQEIAFTAVPVEGVLAADVHGPDRIEARLVADVDMAPMLAAVEKELPETLARIVEWIDDAACLRRNKSLECTSARVDGRIVRDGPARIEIVSGEARLVVAMKFELAIKGIQWASELRDWKSGRLAATLRIGAGLDPALAPSVKAVGGVDLGDASVPILKGKLALGRFVDQRLRRAREAGMAALRKSLAGALPRSLIETAWGALHSPVQLTQEPPAWLAAEPVDVSLAGLVQDDGTVRIAVSIGLRGHTVAGKAPAARRIAPLPAARIVDVATSGPRGRLRLPVMVPLEPLAQAVGGAFKSGEQIRTRADPDRAEMAVRIGGVRLFPARRHIGLAFAVEVAEPATWSGLKGSAYLMGRPELDVASGRLTLGEIVFPDAAQDGGAGGTGAPLPGSGPQIGIEPFASRLRAAGRLELGTWIASLAERASGRRQLGSGLALDIEVTRGGGATIIPDAGGLRVDLELDGTLTVVRMPQGEGASGSGASAR